MTPPRPPVRLRAPRRLLTGAATALAVAALATPGSYAAWRADAAVTAPPVRVGTLDLVVDDQLRGPGGTLQVSGLGLADAIPGESAAALVTLTNRGDTRLSWSVTARSVGKLGTSLTVGAHRGGSASNTGAASAGTRQGACTGSRLFPAQPVPDAGTSVVGAGRFELAPGQSERLCLVVGLPSAAGPDQQGVAGGLVLSVDAEQVPQ